jgi:fatty acid desaturase
MESRNLSLLRSARATRLNRFEHSALTMLLLVAPYAMGVCLVAISEHVSNWGMRLVALPFIAALQNHLQILQHEAAHYNLFPNRRWNDLLSDLFCSIPFLGLTRHYREFHMEHHRHLLDPERDPEVEFYREQNYHFEQKRPAAFLKTLCLDLCGFHYFQFFFSYYSYLLSRDRKDRFIRSDEIPRVAAVGLAALLVIWLIPGGWFYLFFYWCVPQMTWMFLFLKLQGYGEHTKRTAQTETCTSTQELALLTRFFIYPLNSELHLEHHLLPSLKWYELRVIHDRLIRGGISEIRPLRGYFWGPDAVVRRLVGFGPDLKSS